MKELIKEYNKSLYKVQKAYQQTNDDGQKKIISGMIGDIQYTLDWLKTGRRPGSYKGVEAPYRIVFRDPQVIERSHHEGLYKNATGKVEQSDLDRLEAAMCTLSEREKEVYILHNAEGFTFEQIAEMLGIGKSTVQSYMERAHEKIEIEKESNLFCIT